MLKKRQKKCQKRQKKCLKQVLNSGPLSCVHVHVPTRVWHVSDDAWLIGGIDSEHILVIGVTRQCPAEGFLPKKIRPAQWPVQWKNFAPNKGGVGEWQKFPIFRW